MADRDALLIWPGPGVTDGLDAVQTRESRRRRDVLRPPRGARASRTALRAALRRLEPFGIDDHDYPDDGS